MPPPSPSATRIFAAHMAEDPHGARAPVLGTSDLQALTNTLRAIESGTQRASGLYPRHYRVNDAISFDTGLPWNDR